MNSPHKEGRTDMVEIGDGVIFVDEHGVAHSALVICVFTGMSGEDGQPGVNVVIVEPDPEREDSYGRQIARHTSVVHESAQPAHGMFWRARA